MILIYVSSSVSSSLLLDSASVSLLFGSGMDMLLSVCIWGQLCRYLSIFSL